MVKSHAFFSAMLPRERRAGREHSINMHHEPSPVLLLPNHYQILATPWIAAHQDSLSFASSWCLLRLTSIELMMPSYQLILCCPLFLLLSSFPSIRVFSSESTLCIRWPEYWSFSFSLSNKYSGLVSFRINWFDLLAVQWTLKSLLQNHSSPSVLQCSIFFMLWSISHPYMMTIKTIAFEYMDLCWQSDVSAF